MEIPIKMDDLGVPPFKETPICVNWMKKKYHFQVSRQLGSLWVPVLFGGISTGIRTTNLSYLGFLVILDQDPRKTQ